jgi:hypothetical protein
VVATAIRRRVNAFFGKGVSSGNSSLIHCVYSGWRKSTREKVPGEAILEFVPEREHVLVAGGER